MKADNTLMAEAVAVTEGLKLAMAKGYQKMEIEMDSKIIHLKITSQK